MKFYYSHETHWVADSRNKLIAVAPGSFQSELGCAGDWDPGCLRSWLQDPDGDGLYTFRTSALPAGTYEAKVAIGESWNENYGAGGVPNGPNISFTVASDCAEIEFPYDPSTHVLTIGIGGGAPVAQPASVTIAGSFQSELGCSGRLAAGLRGHPSGLRRRRTMSGRARSRSPAGSWEYKAALNDSWNENYGAERQPNGAEYRLTSRRRGDGQVLLRRTRAIGWPPTTTTVIAVAPGSFQSELGCPGDWQPDCLRSWLQDPDGDGIYTFRTTRAAGRHLRGQGRDQRELGRELRRGRRCPAAPTSPFTVPAANERDRLRAMTPVTHMLTIGAEGAQRGNLALARAHWLTADTIAWRPGGEPPARTSALHYDPRPARWHSGPSGVERRHRLPADLRPGRPQPPSSKAPSRTSRATGVFKLRRSAGRGAAALERPARRLGHRRRRRAVDATSLQLPGVLDELYAYDGALGVVFTGQRAHPACLGANRALGEAAPVRQLRRMPTPRAIVLRCAPTRRPASGAPRGSAGWTGRFYLYEVEVYVRSTNQVEHNLVTDPYSISLSRQQPRSQIVDLADPRLKPAGWDRLRKPRARRPRGYRALRAARARLQRQRPYACPRRCAVPSSRSPSHVERYASPARRSRRRALPISTCCRSFDFASIERGQVELAGARGRPAPTFPPDSEQQQAASHGRRATRTASTGATTPSTIRRRRAATPPTPMARARILEFRAMVQAPRQNGLRVVMDVVYNHTSATGQNEKSVLDRIVPGLLPPAQP